MEKIELSQDELKLVLAVFNKVFMQGDLRLGDAHAIVAIASKFQSKVKPDPKPVIPDTANSVPAKIA